MNRIIITGGTGFIGRALSERLARDNEVIVLSRNPDKVKDLPRGVRAEKWDAHTADGWGKLVNADTAVVNLAGESIGIPPIPWTAERKRRIRDSRVNAGRAVVDAVKQAAQKPRVVIQASGIGYYGSRGDDVVTEETPPGKDWMVGVAVDWEASTAEVESLGVRRVIIRTGLPLSFAGGVLPYFALPFRFFVGGPMGSGKQYISWLHITDEIGAIRFLMANHSARGAFNLCAPNPLTNAEFARVLGRVMNRPAFFPTPAFALKFALGEMAELLLLGGQRGAPQRLLQLGYQFQFADAEAALRDLMQTRRVSENPSGLGGTR